jgi:glycosyltransferase involved in cell wall biosynthesis
MSSRPLPAISICIPTFNNELTLERCLTSALAQDFSDFECLVVDDGSRDETVALARRFDDTRVRVLTNPTNLGLAENHTQCVRAARGRLIKFLHADDLLATNCLDTLRRPFEDPSVGFVFSPRHIVIEPPEDPSGAGWVERYGRLETPLLPTAPVMSGLAIVKRYVQAGLRGNWLGEPTSVMVRRSAFVKAGGFHRGIYQFVDMDMWLRILLHVDAGWVSQKVSTRTVHPDTATVRNVAARRDLLDRLWMIEGLIGARQLGDEHAQLRRLRRVEVLRTFRSLAAEPSAGGWRAFGRYIADRLGLASQLGVIDA